MSQDDIIIIDNEERVEFIINQLAQQGISLCKDTVQKVLDADLDFLDSKGLVFIEDEEERHL